MEKCDYSHVAAYFPIKLWPQDSLKGLESYDIPRPRYVRTQKDLFRCGRGLFYAWQTNVRCLPNKGKS